MEPPGTAALSGEIDRPPGQVMAIRQAATGARALTGLLAHTMVLNVGLSLVTRAVMIATGVLSAVITARSLGAAGRGDYVYISTLGLLAVQFANIGMSVDNARNAALDPDLAPLLAGNSLWASIILGLMATLGMAAYQVVTGNGAPLALLSVLMLFVPSTLYGILVSNILIGLGQMKTFNIYTLGTNLLQLLAIFVAGVLTRDPVVVLWANAGAVFVGSVALFWLFHSRSDDRRWLDISLMRRGIAFAGRVYVITLLGFAIGRANVLLLGAMSSKEELGIYSVAMQFGDALMLLPATVAMILFPELVRARTRGGSLAPTLRVAGWTAALLLPPVVALWFAAPLVMHLLFGPTFAQSAQVLRTILPGTFALGVATIFSQSLSAEGVPKLQIVIWIAAGLVLLGLGRALIPTQGANGAGLAFACSYVLAAIGLIGLVFWRARRTRNEHLD